METPNVLRYASLKREMKALEEPMTKELIAIVCKYMSWSPSIVQARVLTTLGLALECYVSFDSKARYLFSFYEKADTVYTRLDFREGPSYE